MVFMAMIGFAQKRQTGDVMYVYHKDGNVNSFVRSEIEEMSFSNEGIDSQLYDEPMTQLIATADSIYRFALSEIDSISFVTPDAVYQPGVVQLDGDLLRYVDRCDSMTIYFAANTPADLLPKVGDKLGIGYLNEKFPDGFAGVVKSVHGTTVECDHEDLEEIFETLFCVMTTDVGQDESAESAARRRSFEVVHPYENDFTFDPYKFDMTRTMDNVIKVGSYAFKGENVMNATIKPTLHLKAEIALRQPFGMRFSGTISGKVHAISNTAIYGSLEFAKDLAYSMKLGNFYGFGFDFKVGAFAKIKGDVTADVESRQQVQFSTGFAIGPKDMIHEKPVTAVKMTENKAIIHKASLDGLLGYGGVVEVGIVWLKDKIAKGVFRAEFGPQYRSNIVLTNTLIENAKTSTALYDRLKNRTIQKYQVVGTSWDFYVMEKYGTSYPAPWGSEQLTDEWDLVPKFSDTELVQSGSSTTAEGSTVAKGNCAFPWGIGMQLHDSNDRYYDMEEWSYLSGTDFKTGRQDLKYTFNNLKNDDSETYKLYPMLTIGDALYILASPSADLQKDDFPVHIIDFRQTDARYSKKQEFEYEGRYYYYKYNAITTVEIDKDAQKVKDWGYVYHDIYNVDKKISCANLGSNPYPDARYAYYYNERSRTVSLTPYIQYEGETDIKKGKEKIYWVEYVYSVLSSCPDEKHPHAIDLGLPSGTLWACCNVGADEPEEFGTYYRSGDPGNGSEVFKADDDTFEFAGTKYDPATVEWGPAWATPTSDQMDELVACCTHEDKYGMPVMDGTSFIFPLEPGGTGYLKVYGPNGNYILLPAAGCKNADGSYKYSPSSEGKGALKHTWTYRGNYWTDYNDGEWVEYLWFSQTYFTDRSLEKNRENEVSFDIVGGKGSNLTLLMPIRPVVKK